MSRIKGRDTKPEIQLRSALHRAGLRFRVCRTDLPGRPDIVFPRQKLAIQVRGCFWHQHEACGGARVPGSNSDYWRPKLERNVLRDAAKDAELRGLGWRAGPGHLGVRGRDRGRPDRYSGPGPTGVAPEP